MLEQHWTQQSHNTFSANHEKGKNVSDIAYTKVHRNSEPYRSITSELNSLK